MSWSEAKSVLKEVRFAVHYLLIMCLGVGYSSLSLFTPTIVNGLGYEDLQAQLYTVPPWALAFVVVLAVGIFSDRYKSRGVVAGVCSTIGAVSFIILGRAHLLRRNDSSQSKTDTSFPQPPCRAKTSVVGTPCSLLRVQAFLPAFHPCAPGLATM